MLRSVGAIGAGAFGGSLAATHDVDGDGKRDWIAGGGAPFAGRDGVAQVVSSASGALLFDLVPASGTRSATFGIGVDAGGDVDGDGVPDFLVGQYGSVHAFSGFDGIEIRVWPGLDAEGFGHAVAFLQDLDRDGLDEVVIASGICTPNCSSGARLGVFSSGSGQALFHGLYRGGRIHTDRDFTGDGIADIDSGGLLLSSGSGAPLQDFGGGVLDSEGLRVRVSRSLLDLDGDGIGELALGAPEDDRILLLRGNEFFVFSARSIRARSQYVRVSELTPGQPALLVVEEIDGQPCHCPVGGLVQLDASGGAEWLVTKGPGIGGHHFVLRSYSIDASGRLLRSAADSLRVR